MATLEDLLPTHAALARQLDFLLAVDALKRVARANRIVSGERQENSAEHSWHVALCAELLASHADEPIDSARVVTMLLVHDIVEIDAGDVPLHGVPDPDQAAKESAAAARLFGLLPDEQGEALHGLWREFEAGETAEARFAKAIDRLQPVLLNHATEGGTWRDFDVTLDQVASRTRGIERGSATLWQAAEAIFADATRQGWLSDADLGD